MADNNSSMLIPTSFIIPDDKNEMKIKLYQYLNNMAITINDKDSGIYQLEEFITCKKYFPNPTLLPTDPNFTEMRSSLRLMIDFGALPNTATKSVAHGIAVSNQYTWVGIKATATNTTALTGIPVPNSWITIDATNVNITTPGDYSGYNICLVELEYLVN